MLVQGPGVEEAIIAGTVGAVLGLAAFPFADYEYWRKWAGPGWSTIGIGLHLLINAGAGIVGWVIAGITNWQPSDDAFINGIAYGVLGQALLRVDYEGFGRDKGRDTATLLSVSSRWVVGMLDARAARGLVNHIDSYESKRLIQQAYRVWMSVDGDPATGTKAKTAILKSIESAEAKLTAAPTDEHAREVLRGICLSDAKSKRSVDLVERLPEDNAPAQVSRSGTPEPH